MALGHTFVVRTPDAALASYLADAFHDLPPASSVANAYDLGPMAGDSRWVLEHNGERDGDPGDAPNVVARLLWRLNVGAVESVQGQLLLHAGGIDLAGRTLLLPAAMEAGKSTLVTGLLCAAEGAGYLSDEAVGVRDGGMLVGYPKAISLDPGSWPLFPSLEPQVQPPVRALLPAQWQVRASRLPGVVPRRSALADLIVLPSYEPHADTELQRLDLAESLHALSRCVFDTSIGRVAALRSLTRLLGTAPCYRLTYGSLEAAVATIRDLLAAPSESDAATGGERDGCPQLAAAPLADTAHEMPGQRIYEVIPELEVLEVAGQVAIFRPSSDELLRVSPAAGDVVGRLRSPVTFEVLAEDLWRGRSLRRSRVAGLLAELLAAKVVQERPG